MLSDKKPKSRIKQWSENVIKRVIKTPFSMSANTAKNAVSKANPFDKKINKDDVSDTGIETVRLANSGIKTVKKSIKTTQRTIKTTGNVVRRTGVTIHRTAVFTVKSAIAVSKFIGNAVIHTVAALMNPVVAACAAIIVVLIIISAFVVMLLGGGISASETNKKAYSSAAGLNNVSSQYKKGVGYLNTALENHQKNFNSLIDSFYYDYDDLTNSSLAYMERTNSDGGKVIYEKSFANDDRKNALKSEWNIALTEREFLAIAYVYLENEKNNSNNSEHGIYRVSYNQEVFDTIVSKCAVYSDNIYGGQNCPDENCTRHVEYVDNPAYIEAVELTDHCWNAYDEWIGIADLITFHDSIKDSASQRAYWDNNIQWRIDNWKSVYFDSCYYSNGGWDYADDLYSWYIDNWNVMVSTPEKIEIVTYICEYKHDLHSVGLAFFDKETVMNALGFDDISKQWVELTEKGFEENPDIS